MNDIRSDTMQCCASCRTPLRSIEYQARAGDEPQRMIKSCPSCPLDASRLTTERRDKVPHVHMGVIQRKAPSLPTCHPEGETETRILIVDCPGDSSRNRIEAVCSSMLDPSFNLYRNYISGPFGGNCIREMNRRRMAPGIEMISLKSFPSRYACENPYVHFTHSRKRKSGYFSFSLDSVCSKEMKLLHEGDDEKIEAEIRAAYLRVWRPESLYACIPRSLVDSMSNLTARGHDSARPPDEGYVFLPKANGERMWMSRVGAVWFYSRRLRGQSILGWEIDISMLDLFESPHGPVLDVEVMIGYPPILIDVLMDADGSISPQDRNLGWIRESFEKMCAEHSLISKVHVRKGSRDYEYVRSRLSDLPYPTDGIVAVSDSGVDMLKLKDVKSIELRLEPSGKLVSSEGTEMFSAPACLLDKVPSGTVCELGIRIKESRCEVTHFFSRPDKETANSSSAVSAIVWSSPEASAGATRTYLWRWSNKIRDELYRRSIHYNPERRVILDIGTGDGQACDSHIKNSACSFILLEPNPDKCKLLARRLGRKKVLTDPRELLRIIQSLKSGKTSHCILNCTLDQVIEDADILRTVIPELKCAVSCFSAHYVASLLHKLCSVGVPCIGCCYLYDGVGVGESLIDIDSIVMRRETEDTASVKWGRDDVFLEPAVMSHHFPAEVTTIKCKLLVPPYCPSRGAEIGPFLDSLVMILSK